MPNRAVANTSNKIIKRAFKKLNREQFTNDRLLGPLNLYLKDTITKTESWTSTPSNVNKSHISQYIASSTICHCYDGWNYISRGIESLLNGDISSCIHFVYYAELRSVMSLMSCEGIGIFSRKHIYFDSSEQEHLFDFFTDPPSTRRKSGTHAIADKLISEWCKLVSKKGLIFKIINPNGRSMEEWIKTGGYSTVTPMTSTVVKDWFEKWSIDLKLTKDQRLRNEMSYRPHFNITGVNINDQINKLIELWEGLEPTQSNRFIDIDKHLWRIAIEEIFIRNKNKSISHPDYKIFIDEMFDNNGESKSGILYDFIFRRISTDNHILIEEAKKDSSDNRINLADPFPMICRAILLLRFSTGFAEQLINECSSSHSLRFWWEDIALKIGIINSIPSGIGTCDLYSEIRESITNIQALGTNTTIWQANSSFSQELNNLKQFQRTCFWGLGL